LTLWRQAYACLLGRGGGVSGAAAACTAGSTAHDDGGNNQVMLITDGVPTIGEPMLERERAACLAIGMRVHSVFVGEPNQRAVPAAARGARRRHRRHALPGPRGRGLGPRPLGPA